MLKTFKYKLNLTDSQEEKLLTFFDCTRFVYNWGLTIENEYYTQSKKYLSYIPLASKLTNLLKDEQYSWLKECTFEALQQSLKNLDRNFKNFFKGIKKRPTFKKKKAHLGAAKFINCVHFNFDKWEVKLPKIGWISLCKNKSFDSSKCKQKFCTIKNDGSGNFWCTVLVEDNAQVAITKQPGINAIGIDLGIKDYVVLSNGIKVENPKFINSSIEKIQHLNKSLSRAKKNSKNYKRRRIVLAKCHHKLRNRRNDFLNKLSKKLVTSYNTICLETLGICGMLKNHNLSKHIQNSSWSQFVEMLKYKAEWYGCNLIFIDRFLPSTKRCGNCGHIRENITLNERSWICVECGAEHDRDINAAKNILFYGMKEIENKCACGQTGVETVEGRGCKPNEAVRL